MREFSGRFSDVLVRDLWRGLADLMDFKLPLGESSKVPTQGEKNARKPQNLKTFGNHHF